MIKYSLSLIIIILFLSSIEKPTECNCRNNSLSVSEAYNQSDIVMIGKIHYVAKDKFFISIEEKWKGRNRDIHFINDGDCPADIVEGEYCLIYAVRSTVPDYFVTNACMRTKAAAAANEEISILDHIAKCVDSSLINHSDFHQTTEMTVCGCDGKTYHGESVAERKGIVVWKKGPCPK